MNHRSRPVDRVNEGDGGGSGRQLIAAVILLLALLGIGLWLSGTLRSASSIQDCVASGRTNCAPIQ
jgi:hypothetical protein